MRMAVADAHAGLVLPAPYGHDHVQQHPAFQRHHLNGRFRGKALDVPGLVRGHVSKRLQPRPLIARNDAGGHRCADALLTAGVGHGDAFDVFDDVSADLRAHAVRHPPQGVPRFGGAVGQGNRFGAAGSRHQFLPQDGAIGLIKGVVSLHDLSPPVAL